MLLLETAATGKEGRRRTEEAGREAVTKGRSARPDGRNDSVEKRMSPCISSILLLLMISCSFSFSSSFFLSFFLSLLPSIDLPASCLIPVYTYLSECKTPKSLTPALKFMTRAVRDPISAACIGQAGGVVTALSLLTQHAQPTNFAVLRHR